MKREGILTDCRFFFLLFSPLWKRETVNISAGVFSLSKASRSKVKFTISSVALATNLRYGGFFPVFSFSKVEKWKATFLRETHDVDGPSRYGTFNNLLPVCLTVYQTRVVCEAGRQRLWNEWFLLHVLLSWSVLAFVVPGTPAELHPIVHVMTRWFCFVKWRARQVFTKS